jgi:hypothetical protein
MSLRIETLSAARERRSRHRFGFGTLFAEHQPTGRDGAQ